MTMTMCQAHWDRLREGIDAAGLGSLVSSSGEEVVEKLRRAQAGEAAPVLDYDPLMNAYMRIVNNAIGFLGLGPFASEESICPICFLVGEHRKQCTHEGCLANYEAWIDYAIREAKEETGRQRGESLA